MATLSRTATARTRRAVDGGVLVLAAALPVLLLHADFQPAHRLALAGTTVDVKLSDLALLAVAVATAVALARFGRTALHGADVLLPGAAFLALALAGVVVGALVTPRYETATQLVVALGWIEYAVLALAVPLLLRDARALRLVLWVLVAWLTFLAVVGLLQFGGLDWHTTSPAGARQPSLIGFHDLSAVGGAALAIGLAAVALGDRWPLGRLPPALCAVGSVGLVLSGSVAAALGLLVAAGLILGVSALAGTLTRRRLALVAAIVLACVAGILLLRGGDLGQFARFAGLLPKERTTVEDVQTYSHRTLLAYLGLRIYADHPVTGAGWQASSRYETLEPHLPDARRRFPDLAEQAFPSPGVAYGVQNAYVQALADLGPLGLLVFLVALALPVVAGARAASRGGATAGTLLAGAAVVTVCAGIWTAQGLVAGIPLLALACLGAGLVVAGRSGRADA